MSIMKKTILTLAAAACLWAGLTANSGATSPATGLTAVPGDYNGTVTLSWTCPEALTPGDKFYVQHSTNPAMTPDYTKAQVVVSTFGTGAMSLRVSGLEYGRTGAAPLFTYYFKLWIEKSSVRSPEASASAVPLTPPAFSTATVSAAGGQILSAVANQNGNGSRLALDSSGNFYLLSSIYIMPSTATTTSSSGLYLMKFSPSGAMLWYRAYTSTMPVSGYGTTTNESANALTIDAAGNLVAVGMVDNGANVFIRKFAPNGDLLWTVTKPVSNTGMDRFNAVTTGPSREIYLAGQQYGFNGKLWLVKLTEAGVPVWEQINANDQTGDYAGTGIALSGAYLYVTGTRNIGYNNDIFVGEFEEIDGGGSLLATFGGPNSDYGRDIKVDASGIYVTGERYNPVSYNNSAWTAKLDASFRLLWEDQFSNAGNSAYGSALALDPLGNVFVTGREFRYDIFQGSNLLLLKYSPAGARLMSRSVDYNGAYEEGYDIKLSSLGVVYAAGSFNNNVGVYRLDLGAVSSNLIADKGPFSGSVNLSWLYPNSVPGGSHYYVQHSTFPAFSWSTATAAAYPLGPVTGLTLQTQLVGGLAASRDAANNVSSPIYYFKAWYYNGSTLSALPGPATAYANTPAAPMERTIDGIDGNLLKSLDGTGVTSSYSGPSMARDAAGNIYMLARANFGTVVAEDYGIMLRKYSPASALLWTRFYHGALSATYDAAAITVDALGNPVIIGEENAPSLAQGDNIWVSKLDADGNQLWTRTYNGSGNWHDAAKAVVTDPSGNIYITGSVYIAGNTDLVVLKYGTNGSGPVVATFAGAASGIDEGEAIDFGDDGSVYVAGKTMVAANTAHYQMAFFKYNASLSPVSASSFGTWGSNPLFTDYIGSSYTAGVDGDDVLYAMKVSTSGYLYAAGYVTKNAGAQKDSWVGRISPSAVLVSTQIGTNYFTDDEFRALAISTVTGEVFTAGYDTLPQQSLWFQNLDQNTLAYKWKKTYVNASLSGPAYPTSIVIDNTGSFNLGVTITTTPISQAGVFKFSPPISALAAATGLVPGGAELTWLTSVTLSYGASYYVQASTWPAPADLALARRYDVMNHSPAESLVRLLAGDLTAGRSAAGVPTQPYYFNAWYSVSAGSTIAVSGTATALPNIPSLTETAYNYPMGQLNLITGMIPSTSARMVRDAAGNIYLGMQTYVYGISGSITSSVILRKYSSSMAPQWTRYYTAGAGKGIAGMTTDQAGNIYICGAAQASGSLYYPYVAKYSSFGDLLWSRSLAFVSLSAGFNGVVSAPDGNVYLSGGTAIDSTGVSVLAKYSQDGVLLSSATYKGAYYYAFGGGIAYNQTDNKLYVAGRAATSINNTCFWVAKFGTDLAFSADKLYCAAATSTYPAGKAIKADADGNLYASGGTFDPAQAGNMLLVKLTPALSEVWISTYNSPGNSEDVANGLALDGFGGVYLAGYENRSDLSQNNNLFFRKYNAATGEIVWTNSFNSAGNSSERGFDVAVDTSGYVYLPGVYSYGTNSQSAYGYFKYRQLSIGASNPALTLNVTYNGTGTPLKDVNVFLLAFNQAGSIDPAGSLLGLTDVNGRLAARLAGGAKYFIGLSTPGYVPTLKDQLMDPNGNFYATLLQDTTKSYQLYPRAVTDPVYTMTVNVTDGLLPGDYLMGELTANRTGEKVAYGVLAATAAAGQLKIFNVPPAPAGTYAVSLSIPGKSRYFNFFMDTAFPGVSSYSVDMTSAVFTIGTFDTTGSTVPPSFQGLVRSSETALPLGGVRVELSMWQCLSANNCSPTNTYEKITDVNGQFSFYNVPSTSTPYNLNVRKQGYRSWYDQILISTITAGTAVVAAQYREYTLTPATYTISGIVKYNGIPVPNASIKAWGDQNTYNTGDDSYSGRWDAAMQTDAKVRSGADGSFLIEGLPDGRVRMNMDFMGTKRDLNNGPDNMWGTSDDIKMIISSDTSKGPSLPAGNPCRPGRNWVLDSSGGCQTDGSMVFNIVPAGGNNYGRLYGTVVFVTTYTISAAEPLVIPAASPVTLMAVQDCNDNCSNRQMGFLSLAGVFTSSSTAYSITLSSGISYYASVMSSDWGKNASFNDRVNLTSTDTVAMNFTLTRSGGLRGAVKLPDGSTFKPYYGNNGEDSTAYFANIEVRGVNLPYNSDTKLDDFGNFEFPNLPPGLYDVYLKPQGGAFRWPPQEVDNITVSVGNTVDVNIRLEDGLVVQPQIFGLPALSTPTWAYNVIGVPSGFQMNQKNITEMFFEEPKYSFSYSTTTASWDKKFIVPGQYDFYLVVGASYNPGGDSYKPLSYYQFANFIGRVKNLSIQKSDVNTGLGTLTQPIPVNILGSIGQNEMKGLVTGTKIFTDRDFEKIFANFDSEILQIIPAVMLYDNAGDLRAFTNAMPDEAGIVSFEAGINARDKQMILDSLAAHPLRYFTWGLPPGRYTAVFANPNYPPVPVDVTLPRQEDPLPVFAFDSQQITVGSIYGVVRSSATGEPLSNAGVYLKHRTVEKFAVTDSSGAFRFENLPTGIYRLEVNREGFVKTGRKTSLAGNDSAGFDFYMLQSDSVINGSVYLSKFPAPSTRQGITIVAYDETLNVESPSSYLPKLEVQTGEGGDYSLPGVVPGHTYKISAMYSGKLPEVLYVEAVEGVATAGDIVLRDIPPQITIKVRKSPDSYNKVDVEIRSPRELISTPVCRYNPGNTYSSADSVSLALVPGPNNTFIGQFTVASSQQYYNVYVSAGDNTKMEKSVVYDQVSDAKTEQYIQEEAIAGGEISMDKEKEDYSGMELDAGTLSYSTYSATTDFSNLIGGFFSALPSVRTVKTAKGNATLESAIKDLMASEIYNLDLSNAQPNKDFTLTLKYDKEKVYNTGGLRIYQYDETSASWKEVPGNYTVDPMTGVVSVEVASLDRAYEGSRGASTPLGRKRMKMSSVSGGRYVVTPSAAGGSSSQTGKFAVFSAKPPTGTAAFSSAFEVYNMPNPFSLKAKTVAVSSDGQAILGASYSTNGTLIKYNLPAGKSGDLKFVIYNFAGEKVRTIDEGSRAGNQVYYSEWDGRNDNGSKCASGVYFMLTFQDGKKLGSKAHKMAIIK